MNRQSIVMNFTVPPSADDFDALASVICETLPDELSVHYEELTISIDEMADDTILDDLGVDDPYELLALYKSGKEISPGVERTVANDDDVLVLYRRAILDMWCETGDDLQALIRQVIIEELGRYFELSDDDIEDMAERYMS